MFYELGVRHALRKRWTVLIKAESSADKTPFDIGGFRYLGYDAANPSVAVERLAAAIRNGLRSDRETDSPVFQSLRALPEAPSDATVPAEFTAEVGRAVAAKDRGWLQLLAEDVRGLRFERAGMRHVAFAQFALQDFEPARRNLEALANVGDIGAQGHFSLANIYERLYRQSKREEDLIRSQQALDAV
ncbi:MAG: hypothetical protein FJX57_17270, partial [Alphaproteobacteria bacterium]|nr:hypothetical protein [Alphaproteobacteria bacterium]